MAAFRARRALRAPPPAPACPCPPYFLAICLTLPSRPPSPPLLRAERHRPLAGWHALVEQCQRRREQRVDIRIARGHERGGRDRCARVLVGALPDALAVVAVAIGGAAEAQSAVVPHHRCCYRAVGR